jgi:membrane protease YdiL (CAAX protease family)
MNSAIRVAGTLALLLVAGLLVGLTRPKGFSLRWLLIAAGLVGLNDFLLTRGFGLIPDFLPSAHWNWQGKIFALMATLVVASLPQFGWRRSGLTVSQTHGSVKSCISVALAYCAFFVVMAFVFPDYERASTEAMGFQLSLPGLEEEPFYRGVLLLALDRAFAGRIKALGVKWGWGAVLSCALFGLAHAFSYHHSHFGFDPLTMALTALPSFIAVWVRLRSGSVLIPVLLHNFGNSISMLV